MIGNLKRHNTAIDSLVPGFVKIGDNFVSGPGSLITAHDASPLAFLGAYKIAPVVVGNNVFLGAGAIVLPGVTIGDNVIIGAGSVVASDIPSGVVAVGVPARVLRTLDEHLALLRQSDDLYPAPFTLNDTANWGVSERGILRLRQTCAEEFRRRHPGRWPA
jgi:acetyltransferase-like isoleucine patch superfamily enzyme